MSLSDLAGRLGFSDYGAFSRAFARWTGTRPSSVYNSEEKRAETRTGKKADGQGKAR